MWINKKFVHQVGDQPRSTKVNQGQGDSPQFIHISDFLVKVRSVLSLFTRTEKVPGVSKHVNTQYFQNIRTHIPDYTAP